MVIKGVQQHILDENTVLLQYFLGNEQSYLWVVTKEKMSIYERPSDVIEAVKAIAIREGINNDSTRFHQIFVELIEKRGILFEPELMHKYGGLPAMRQQAILGMQLALRGKLSPLPAKVKDPQKFTC